MASPTTMDNNYNNDPSSPPSQRSNNRPKCTHPGCTNNAVKSSVCIRHGATQPSCTAILNELTGERCTSRARQGGLCIKHGAKITRYAPRQCSYTTTTTTTNYDNDGEEESCCTNKAQRGGLCTRHWYEEHSSEEEGGGIIYNNKLAHRKLCIVEDCTNQARRGGVCTKHGATQNKKKRKKPTLDDSNNNGEIKRYKHKECSEEGCNKQAVRGGICIRHGGTQAPHKLCKFILINPYTDEEEQCQARANFRGLCIRHGGSEKRECSEEGCTSQAVRGGVCISHGGTQAPRKLCSIEDCTNLARKGGVCTKHGAKQIQSPNRICKYEGCGKYRRGKGMMCNMHEKLQEAIIGNNIFLPLPFAVERNIDDDSEEEASTSSKEDGDDDDGLVGDEGKMPITCQFITEEGKSRDNNNDADEAEIANGSSDSSASNKDGESDNGSDSEDGGKDDNSSVDEEGIHYGNNKEATKDKGHVNSEHSDSAADDKNMNDGSDNIPKGYVIKGFPYGNNVLVAEEERPWFNDNVEDSVDGLEFDDQPLYLTQKHQGSKPKLRPKCKVKGCTNGIVGSIKGPRLCLRHGAKNPHPRCSIDGCTKFAQPKAGMCWRHEKEAAGEKIIRRPRQTDPNNLPKRIPHPTHKRKYVYQCAEEGCTKQATGAGKCWVHGAKYCPNYVNQKRKLCSEEGCTNQVVNNGVCIKHGAVLKKCNYGDGGCANSAVPGCDVCALHGGVFKRRCKHKGCSRWPVAKGVCILHGATKTTSRRICSFEGCTHYSVQKGVCTLHGAKKVRKECSHEGCTNQVQKGGVCIRHVANKNRCGHHEDCTTIAWKGGLCKRHQEEGTFVPESEKTKKGSQLTKRRCNHDGCTR